MDAVPLSQDQIRQLKEMGFRPCMHPSCGFWIGPADGETDLSRVQVKVDGEIMQIQFFFRDGGTIGSGDAWCCMDHLPHDGHIESAPAFTRDAKDVVHVHLGVRKQDRWDRNRAKRERRKSRR